MTLLDINGELAEVVADQLGEIDAQLERQDERKERLAAARKPCVEQPQPLLQRGRFSSVPQAPNLVEAPPRLVEATPRLVQAPPLLVQADGHGPADGHLEVMKLRRERDEALQKAQTAHAENAKLRQENEDTLARLAQAEAASAEQPRCVQAQAHHGGGTVDSESALRRALTTQGSSLDDLRKAIKSVDANLLEAKRELASRELRERRAAYEELYRALEQASSANSGEAEESRLEAAVVMARAAEVGAEDLGKAEAKLRELKALTGEQRAEQERKKLDAARKKEAFLMVKKDNADKLKALLATLESEGVKWQEWRDYAGRDLWRCAKELRAESVKQLLAPDCDAVEKRRSSGSGRPSAVFGAAAAAAVAIFAETSEGMEATSTPKAAAATVSVESLANASGHATVEFATDCLHAAEKAKAEGSSEGLDERVTSATSNGSLMDKSRTDFPKVPEPSESEDLRAHRNSNRSKTAPPSMALDEEAILRAKAFRAVAQDDEASLQSVLERFIPVVWESWMNKGGKDLITLSQERGSSNAYSVLAKALGIVKEQARDTFEEREAVWIFLPGEVQPRRATVLEDTSEDADDVLIEYWDGDGAPFRQDRCMVRKMG